MLRAIGLTEALVLLISLAVVGLVFVWIRKVKGFTVMGTVLWAWSWLIMLAMVAEIFQTKIHWLEYMTLALAGIISYGWFDLEKRREGTGPWRRFAGTILLILGTSMIAGIPDIAWTSLAASNVSTLVLLSLLSALSLLVSYILSFRKTCRPIYIAEMEEVKSFRIPQTRSEKIGWWIGSLIFRRQKAKTADPQKHGRDPA
ncbi:MAG: hypothetical protein ACLQVN_12490 [Bryobacteraceae bacterium]